MSTTLVRFGLAGLAVAATAVAGVVVYKRRQADTPENRMTALLKQLEALDARRVKTTDPQELESILEEMADIGWRYGVALGEHMYAEAKQAA